MHSYSAFGSCLRLYFVLLSWVNAAAATEHAAASGCCARIVITITTTEDVIAQSSIERTQQLLEGCLVLDVHECVHDRVGATVEPGECERDEVCARVLHVRVCDADAEVGENTDGEDDEDEDGH